jgi:hypothetical protein
MNQEDTSHDEDEAPDHSLPQGEDWHNTPSAISQRQKIQLRRRSLQHMVCASTSPLTASISADSRRNSWVTARAVRAVPVE